MLLRQKEVLDHIEEELFPLVSKNTSTHTGSELLCFNNLLQSNKNNVKYLLILTY